MPIGSKNKTQQCYFRIKSLDKYKVAMFFILSLPQPWRIVPPALVFNSAFAILSSFVLYKAVTGFQAFCLNVTNELNLTRYKDTLCMCYATMH